MNKLMITVLLLALTGTAYASEPAAGGSESSEETEAVVTAPGGSSPGRRPEIYTPQQAIADTLSEPLTFVGRGIPNPILDENDVVITDGASQYCVFKNSKVYVVHQGCRPNTQLQVSVMIMEVYRRTGQSIRFYAEPSTSSYSLESIGSGFSGSWNITYQRTPMINGELSLSSFFEYYNTQQSNYDSGRCTYGKSVTGGTDVRLICVRMPEENSFRDAAAAVYSTPANARFNEFHNAIRFHSRN